MDEKRIWQELDQILSKAEKETVKTFRQALREIREEIALTYEKYAVEGSLTQQAMNKYNRLGKLEAAVVEKLSGALNRSERVLQASMTATLTKTYYSFWLWTNEKVGVGIDFNLLNKEMIEGVLDNPLKEIAQKQLKFLGRTRIRRALRQGVIRGESYQKMVKKVRGAINGTANDARRIVRTEGHRAQEIGHRKQIENALQKGVKMKVRWDATLDSRTRPSHQVMDGKYAVIHTDGTYHFNTPVGAVDGPGLSGDPGFDINCRCRAVQEDLEAPPETRRAGDRGEREVIKYKNYRQWAEEKGIYQRHKVPKYWRG